MFYMLLCGMRAESHTERDACDHNATNAYSLLYNNQQLQLCTVG